MPASSSAVRTTTFGRVRVRRTAPRFPTEGRHRSSARRRRQQRRSRVRLRSPRRSRASPSSRAPRCRCAARRGDGFDVAHRDAARSPTSIVRGTTAACATISPSTQRKRVDSAERVRPVVVVEPPAERDVEETAQLARAARVECVSSRTSPTSRLASLSRCNEPGSRARACATVPRLPPELPAFRSSRLRGVLVVRQHTLCSCTFARLCRRARRSRRVHGLATGTCYAATGRAGGWVRPVDGDVARAFTAPQHRFGPGHVGVDFRAAPGTAVRAAGPVRSRSPARSRAHVMS